MRRCFALLLILSCAGCRDADLQARRLALQPDYPLAKYDQALAYKVGRGQDSSGKDLAFQPSFIVIHVAQGYYLGTISWFNDPASGVSSHYVVSKAGDVTQMVEEKDTAYHVGHSLSLTSVGIEHEGFIAEPAKWFTDAMYAGSGALVKNIAERWGIPRDRCHIIGHDEVPDPKNPCVFGGSEHHTDPGTGWDWTKLMGHVGGSATKCSYTCSSTKGSLVGHVREGSLLPTAPPIAGATVSIGAQTTSTDATGFYHFDNLNVGYYVTITASKPGFKTASQNQAVVMPLDNYSSFALTPGASPDAGPPSKEAGLPKQDAGTTPRADRGPAPAGDQGSAAPDQGDLTANPAGDVEELPPPEEPPASSSGCSVAVARSGRAGLVLLLAPLVVLLARRRKRR